MKVVSESRVMWATSVPILVFLGLSVLELGPMYATDRRQTKASLNASALWGRRHKNRLYNGAALPSAAAREILRGGDAKSLNTALAVVVVVTDIKHTHTHTPTNPRDRVTSSLA